MRFARRRPPPDDPDARLMAFAEACRPADPEVARAWPLILHGLTHQGRPSSNLATIVEMVDRTTRLAGWDEFAVEDVDGRLDRVAVYFLGDEVTCDRSALRDELAALRAACAGGE